VDIWNRSARLHAVKETAKSFVSCNETQKLNPLTKRFLLTNILV
jgi:hypothetical protein